MNAIVFCGLQGSGKSRYFFDHFSDTHVRLNLDMLKTRNREDILLHACLAAQQPFVIDNTNPTPEQRQRYIALARSCGFEVEGYYFNVPVELCLQRNAARPERQRVPDVAIYGTSAKLVRPTLAEGFSKLFEVRWDKGSVRVEGLP